MHGSGLELALVFLLAAVIAVPVFKRFGLGGVLGYLAAGVALGPHGLRAVADADPVLAASAMRTARVTGATLMRRRDFCEPIFPFISSPRCKREGPELLQPAPGPMPAPP